MNQYNVTLQAVVNVRVSNVDAATAQEAIDVALDRVDLYGLLESQKPAPKVDFTEYAEEVREALVDEVGDEEFDKSRWFIWHNGQWVPANRPRKPKRERTTMPKRTKNQKPPSLQVIVTVSGGVADVLFKPAGVALALYDYDTEGSDENEPGVSRDPDGHLCCISEWEPSEEIVGSDNWPIIKKAREVNFCRTWNCPDCGRTVEHSYEALAEVGAPTCHHCDIEMELL